MSAVPDSRQSTSLGGDPVPSTSGRRDASMVLLTSLVEDSLDQGYARAAARRAAGEAPSRGGPVVLAAGLVAVGLLLATAAEQARQRASTTAEARAALAAEVQDRAADNERLVRELERTRLAVSRDRQTALRLTERGAGLARSLSRLEAATGAGAVRGPGMSVRLEEAPTGDVGGATDPRNVDDGDNRVSDRDLQTLVNEVWAAGAEAVSVNGQRLTALSAIRSAGEAVLVDYRPLAPPYVVLAVGPPQMRETFVSGFGGSYLQVLRDYGITYAVDDRDQVLLPASAGVTLRYAAASEDVGSSTPSSSTGREPG